MTGNMVRFSVYTIHWKVQKYGVADRKHHAHVCAIVCPPMISNALVFSLMDLSTPSSPPVGEPRRVACSGLTGQRSGNTRSIAVLVLWFLQMTSDLK